MAIIIGTKKHDFLFSNNDFDVIYGDPGDNGDGLVLTKKQASSDFILGTGNNQNLYGDVFTITDKAKGGNDKITADYTGGDFGYFLQFLSGDANLMHNNARGGNDHLDANLTVGDMSRAIQFLRGDAQGITDNAKGGNDKLHAELYAGDAALRIDQQQLGDAFNMLDNTKGGNDNLSGSVSIGDGSNNVLLLDYYGDAGFMRGSSQGGNDHISGELTIGDNSTSNFLRYSGDSFQMYDFAEGGDDTLSGPHVILGDNTTLRLELWGDAANMGDNAKGGDDVLIGADITVGAGSNPLLIYVGDAFNLRDNTVGGDDTIISGLYNEFIAGDAVNVAPTATTGHDLFVFEVNGFGNDTILDFEAAKDILAFEDDLSTMDFDDLDALVSSVTDAGGNIAVNFASGDSVNLQGIGGTLGDGNISSLDELAMAIDLSVDGSIV